MPHRGRRKKNNRRPKKRQNPKPEDIQQIVTTDEATNASSANVLCVIHENKAKSHFDVDTEHRKRMVGFGSRNQHNIQDKYLCKICSLILREPVQLNCAHRQCKSCVESKIERGIIICPECREETNEKEVFLDKGCKNDMKTLLILCSLCDWSGIFKDYENHLQEAHQNPSCNFCGQKFDSISQLDVHKLNECEKVTLPCALVNYGCSSSVPRVQRLEHYLTLDHQNAIMSFIFRDTLKIKTEQYEGASGMDVDIHSQTSTPTNVNTQLTEVSETIDVLFGGLQALNEDVQRLSHEAEHLQSLIDALSKDVATLKLSIDEQNTYIDTLKPTQEILTQEVLSLKQKVEDIIFLSNEGIYIWKITNMTEKMSDAQADRQTSIYSSPFYSSPTGYKMRVRLYPFGDGNARKTHMSLFFVLMRSEYDAILKFPFNYKVTFCIYDQSGSQRHIIDSFRPDAKSNSFQRPRTEMNIASGIPKFVELSKLQESASSYIRDDTMFIKIMIDFIDMPKALLAFALSLNPAFPINVQQTLIKQEEKKVQPVSTPTT